MPAPGLMSKKLVLIAIVLLLALAQSYFIHAVQSGGAEAFSNLWNSFGVSPSAYSRFVLGTIRWWWALPVICLLLAGLSAWRGRTRSIVLAAVFSLIGTVVLYGSVYAPSLFIQV